MAGAARTPVPRRTLCIVAAALAVLPDLDVLAFRLGIPYAHPLGHRGVSHSLAFAFVAAFPAALWLTRRLGPGQLARVTLVLALATASHGLLDALTDAGLGVGFFLPFHDARVFFPWRPLATSPIGVGAFFRGPAASILANEVVFVWVPVLLALGGWRRARASRRRGAA